MSVMFIASIVLLAIGLSAMDALMIVLGFVGLVYSGSQIDKRQESDRKRHWDSIHQHEVAQTNGHVKGKYELVRSDDE